MKLLATSKREDKIDIFVTFTVVNSFIYSNALLACLFVCLFVYLFRFFLYLVRWISHNVVTVTVTQAV
jgi:hypothetical protein